MYSLLLSIVVLRLCSGAMEIIAALLIYRFHTLEHALKINAVVASIGPLIFLAAMYLGLSGLTQQAPYSKLVFIYLGVALIFYGMKS